MMTKSAKAGLITVATLAALAIGGGAAYAGTSTPMATSTQSSTSGNSSTAPATPESGAGVEQPEPAGSHHAADTDGPGGHADPDGANVDHQFNGNE